VTQRITAEDERLHNIKHHKASSVLSKAVTYPRPATRILPTSLSIDHFQNGAFQVDEDYDPSWDRLCILLIRVDGRLCCSLSRTRGGCLPHGMRLEPQETAMLISVKLNDVLSLCVGLWAVKVANQKSSSKMYTYGVSNTTYTH
jgi:hypothetical protein